MLTWLPFVLSAIAALGALAALVAALRTRRHVRRLAKALAREWGLRFGGTSSVAPVPPGPADVERDASLRRSIHGLEQRLQDMLARSADLERAPARRAAALGPEALDADAPLEPGELVRQRLAGQGYDDVVLLADVAQPRDEGGRRFVFEGRRQGLPVKGRARVDALGRFTFSLAGRHRIFP